MRREHANVLASGVPSDYSTKDGTREGGEHKMHNGKAGTNFEAVVCSYGWAYCNRGVVVAYACEQRRPS